MPFHDVQGETMVGRFLQQAQLVRDGLAVRPFPKHLPERAMTELSRLRQARGDAEQAVEVARAALDTAREEYNRAGQALAMVSGTRNLSTLAEAEARLERLRKAEARFLLARSRIEAGREAVQAAEAALRRAQDELDTASTVPWFKEGDRRRLAIREKRTREVIERASPEVRALIYGRMFGGG